MRWSLFVPSVLAGCVLLRPAVPEAESAGPSGEPSLPDFEPAPRPTGRVLAEAGDAGALASRIDSWFGSAARSRVHLQLDRPLYRPGESVWVKSWSLRTRSFSGLEGTYGVTFELLDPQGSVVETKQVQQTGGTGTNDFVLPAEAPGGRWTLRVTDHAGATHERPFVVAAYTAPRIRKELEFVREAYGAGDRVEALVELTGADGAPFANRTVRALLQVGGDTVAEEQLTTDDTGAVLAGGRLPATLHTSDGLLTVLVEDGGVTESISRSIPIVRDGLKLSFFPEGGDLVRGLPGRVYFEAQDEHGEPADVHGAVYDDTGARVAAFGSVHDGLGRFSFTPAAGRRYHARITQPEGIAGTYALPEAQAEGCTLRSFDDVKSTTASVRVAVRCTQRKQLTVVATMHDEVVEAATVQATPGVDAVIYLTPHGALAQRQGAVRVTVFDGQTPLAERLVYRNAGKNLRIEVKPDRESYGPRDPVRLAITTRDPAGEPVAAEVALAVVDDAVIALADDEEGNLLSRMYLESEVVESPDDPAWYFDAGEPQAARGLDLVLGTRGWRRFDWAPVFAPPPPPQRVPAGRDYQSAVGFAEEAEEVVVASEERARRVKVPMAPPVGGPPMAMAPMAAPPMAMPDAPVAPMGGQPMPMEAPMDDDGRFGPVAARPMAREVAVERAEKKKVASKEAVAADRAWGAEDVALRQLGYVGDEWGGEQARWDGGYAPVRVFPVPDPAPFDGVRSDFRDTVFWAPTVVTDAEGHAEVTFPLSDAVGSFRVTAEGVAGGAAGHDEVTFPSVLPISVATKLPPAVSAGDRLLIPLTVTNTRDRAASVATGAEAESGLLRIGSGATISVPANGSATRYVPVEVGAGAGHVALRISAEGGGTVDAVERTLDVVPAGFPQAWSASGRLVRTSEHAFHLDEPVQGSLVARVAWHPSTVASLVAGLEGLISMPGGCFEQTSSTNWPNVAILNYLETHEGEGTARVRAQSGAALRQGYDILTGYQIGAGGFETWGDGPGKEALSAFGLLQFTDMARVYPVAGAVISRDVDYLLGQRDGQGGFRNTGESAHGYGSAPKPVLDGFITWALVATGHGSDLEREIAAQAAVAKNSKDPYVLALAARSLLATKHPAAREAVERLRGLQAEDGSWPGAESSITRSYEANLVVESTALATLAMLEGGHFAEGDRGAAWIADHRQGPGTWGATQATALALAALAAHADQARRPQVGGHLVVEVNGTQVGELDYEAGSSVPLEISGFEHALRPGADNRIVLRQTAASGEPGELPYTVDVAWRTVAPRSEPGAELALTTALDRASAKMGETVRLTAKIANRTRDVVPSPIARIGLPAGLEPQIWQLEELQDRGVVSFYETRPREVTLYWDGVHANQAHTVNLDLLAAVPGEFTGPASGAWPYYDDDEKAWTAGLKVAVAAP